MIVNGKALILTSPRSRCGNEDSGPANLSYVEKRMGFVSMMWALWGAAFCFMAAVSLYSSRLARNEEDQIFLSDSSSQARSEQHAIAARIGKIQPLRRTAFALAGVMTIFVLGYYVLDMVHQLR